MPFVCGKTASLRTVLSGISPPEPTYHICLLRLRKDYLILNGTQPIANPLPTTILVIALRLEGDSYSVYARERGQLPMSSYEQSALVIIVFRPPSMPCLVLTNNKSLYPGPDNHNPDASD